MPRRRRRRAERRRAPARRARGRRHASLGWLAPRLAALLVVVAVVYAAWLDLMVRSRFEGQRWQLPARIYARALEVYRGAPVGLEAVLSELESAGYHRDGALARPATFRVRGRTLELRTRSFRFWDADEPERRVAVSFAAGQVSGIREGGRDAALLRLEPAPVGHLYPGHLEDRVLVRLADVPRALVDALIAVEDRAFFEHHGVSVRGIARAALANLRAGQAVQGGSTLTQQLAKSYFLSSERSLWRKVNDVLIALVLEARYSKEEILEAYLNEVYLGQDGPRAIHGFGLGAQHYFGRRLDELRLPELALLAGLVKGPSLLNPWRHPERARVRRDLVLSQMAGLGLIGDGEAARARAAPLGVSRVPGAAGGRYPAFVDLVRRQLRSDYRDEDLRGEGLRIFTTLDPAVQGAAERALARGVERIERDRGLPAGALEGAVVVTHPQSAEVLAVVGGRDPGAAGFNRAVDARRPIGSLVKPVVYLAALAHPERYTLATRIDDAPVRVRTDDASGFWEPKNYDGTLHGSVTLIEALSRSYNLATVRLGMDVGIAEVADALERMGVERDVPAYPSLLLGAVEMSPLEVGRVYQTIAGGGFRQPMRAIREVTDRDGRPLQRYGIEVEAAADPRAAYLVTRAMQEVVATGTARRAGARLDPALSAAGKTGTTDDLRDSWFAGFAGDLLAVVWLGRDDNAVAGLTGADGALEVWTDLLAAVRARPLAPPVPDGVEWYPTDLARGVRLTDACASAGVALPYVAGSGPDVARCVGGATTGWGASRGTRVQDGR